MQKHWLIRRGNPDLIVYALGWASDQHAVEHIAPDGCDVLCLFDYRGLEPLETGETAGYGRIFLFGWSFGVWAAEQVCRDIPLYRAVALNGTPQPVDDRNGIPRRSFGLTLRSIRRTGIETFNRRVYGESYDRMAPWLETRPFEEKFEELEFLSEAAQHPYTPGIGWHKAILGSRDVIFPPENMLACWGEKAVIAEDMPHYPFGDPRTITDSLKTDNIHDNR